MGKITKAVQPKHKETLSPMVQEFVDLASSTPLHLLTQTLATFPSRWPFPRGDLYHWIPLLNRFDDLLESFCQIYKLNEGPQTREFGCELLLHFRKSKESDGVEKLPELDDKNGGDAALIESILKFTQMLLDHCGNRSIYASSAHLNDLLNSTDFNIICATLQVGVELAQRYQASVKRIHGMATRQVHTALLSNHYNIDLERVQQLAQPFVKTPIVKPTEPSSSSTPASVGKGKDKPSGGSTKNAASMFANDLCSIARYNPDDTDDSRTRWKGWADVKLTYYPSSDTPAQEDTHTSVFERGNANAPSTPTPLRRSNSAQTPHSTPPRINRQISGSLDDAPGSASRAVGGAREEGTSHGQQSLVITQAAVNSSSIFEALSRAPSDLPSQSKYEYLNRLRVAKALTGSVESRQQALKARLLAIQNLAYIHVESTFIEKVLRQDSDEPRRFQLVYQLAELIHPGVDGERPIPLDLQSIALSLLEAIASFHSRVPDIFSALNATVNHGVLLYIIKKAVAEMKSDDTGEQWTLKDEWRDKLFSLTLHITMAMANTSVRNTPEIIAAGLLDILVEILNLRSNVAERTHGTLVGFLDSLVYNVQSSFESLASAKGLDAITNLITHEVDLAKQLVATGQGTPASHRSQIVDYEIPFYQQQNLKFLLKFIHHLMANTFNYQGNTERLLRNLVDKSDLLNSLREIIENMKLFGSLVWTNSVVILGDFLNNDPTSFSAIFDAGLIQSYLTALTGRAVKPGPTDSTTTSSHEHDNREGRAAPDVELLGSDTGTDQPEDTRTHPPPQRVLELPRDHPLGRGILASVEPISTVPSVLNAICLNNQGMKMVVSTRALDSFFEIFESPEHVRVMLQDESLSHAIGGSFDELARHHPSLRPTISNAVLDMIARVTYLGRTKARDCNWGAQLVHGVVSDTTTAVPKERKPNDEVDVQMLDIDAQDDREVDSNESDNMTVHSSMCPYVSAIAGFLSHYLHNNNLKMTLVNNGCIEQLLDLYTSPSLPYDFATSDAARNLQQVISSLVEAAPIYGIPSVLKRTQAAVSELGVLVEARRSVPYFKPIFAENEVPNVSVVNATPVIKALLNAQSLMNVLLHSFPFTSRAQTVTLPPVNFFDYHSQLIRSLGPLIQAIIVEKAAMASHMPRRWWPKTDEQLQAISRLSLADTALSEEGERELRKLESFTLPEVLSAMSVWKYDAHDTTETEVGLATEAERLSPRYQNFQIIQVLLDALVPTTLSLFQTYGRALLPRRDRDLYARTHHMQLAEDLALTVLRGLDIPDSGLTVQSSLYLYIVLFAVHDLLIPNPAEARSDRQIYTPVIVPVLLAFKRHGGLKLLNTMLIKLKNEICQEHQSGEEVRRLRLGALSMKKILDLYAVIASGKTLTDAVSQVHLLQRSSGTDRRADAQVAPNLVVDIRARILPVVRELWESPLVEQGTQSVVRRTIEILKSITAADFENNAYKRSDKTSLPAYLELTNIKFPWSQHSDLKRSLRESSTAPDDLVREAIYRSNGGPAMASDYCMAHEKGIAGSRNPIPEKDRLEDAADVPSPADPTESANVSSANTTAPENVSSGVISNNAVPANGEDMTLDGLDTADAEFLRYLRDGAPASNEPVVPQFLQRESDEHDRPSTSSAQDPTSGTEAQLDESEPTIMAKEDLDEERNKLRVNLIDRCLDVIGAHPDAAYEISELITSIVHQGPGEDASSIRQEIGETLVNALMSFAMDDDLKSNGRCIAAYAHLLSLLLQEKLFFKVTATVLKENVSEFLRFLNVPSSSSEELAPWIPYILLIFEILLSDDENGQLDRIEWKVPEELDPDTVEPLKWNLPDLNVKQDERTTLLALILEILPRIGKEESLAIAVFRILVILTRDRTVARQIGDRKNLQRLFVTAKQLSGGGSLRLNQTKISSYILTILRHIIEDEEVIKQIMRSEIQTWIENGNRRNSQSLDAHTYLKHFSHMVLRDPKLFSEVSNDMLKIPRWAPPREGSSAKFQPIILKDQPPVAPKDEVAPAVRATEDLSIHDIKPSTENEEKSLDESAKSNQQDAKRPVIENPDGVIHFLLCELLNYKEVDDKEPAHAGKDAKSTSEQSSTSTSAESETRSTEGKDKKTKASFKSDEHPIFIYRCFLLHCLTELLQSYNRTKIEFINFKRNAPLFANTPVKPRASVLNYLLTDLLYPSHLEGSSDTILHKKRYATAVQTQHLLVALVSKTGEKPVTRGMDKYEYDDESDLMFVRKFVLDTILKSYKDATASNDPFDSRYARMLALSDVMHLMMGENKDKDSTFSARNPADSISPSQAQMRRLMYEKGYLAALTASIADIDLAFPPVKRTIKYILRVLRILTSTAIHLSHSNIIPSTPSQDNIADELISTSSISDIEDDREETPDLYRNSALGMLEPGRDMDEDYSEDSEDDDDEEMYDEEYDEAMEYESEDREEDVSDREDEDLESMGPIEGLSGEPGVIEVTMDDDDDDDEMDDDDDEDDESDDEDDDSDGMDDVDDRIEFADAEGNPLEDDGASGWESETDEAIDDEHEEIDYEEEAHDLQEAAMHHLDDVDGLGRFGNIMRVIGEGGDFQPVEELSNLNERFMESMEDEEDDEADEDEDEMDDEYAFEEDFPNDAPPRDIVAPPSLGWDTVVLEQGAMFGNRRRQHTIDRHPALPFIMGHRDIGTFSDPRARTGHSRDTRAPNNEDGVNPLLRRNAGSSRDASPRPSNAMSNNFVRLGFTGSLVGGPGHDNTISVINDLMASLPMHIGRHGHAFQLSVAAGAGHRSIGDIPLPFNLHSRDFRSDSRRDTYQEPIQSTSFNDQSTINRWIEEVKIIFGPQYQDTAAKLHAVLASYLVPPAMRREMTLQAEEQRAVEEKKKKREEEEKKIKEAEEKAAQEKKEAEERERAAEEEARALAAAAAAETQMTTDVNHDLQSHQPDVDAMEGIEQTENSLTAAQDGSAPTSQARVFTTIRGEQVDVTELGIDPDYLEALPEEFREEVIAQTVSSRRAEAREAPGRTGEQQPDDLVEFLNALPDDLRQEIIQQERQEQRRRDNSAQRRAAAGQANVVAPGQDMDAASILMTFPPALRDEVLLDQGAEIVDHLPPELAAQARRILRHQQPSGVPDPRPSLGSSRVRDAIQAATASDNDRKPPRKTVVQMLDKSGVATLLRLMFINMKGGSIENSLKNVFKDVCENMQNRIEVVSTLLQILQDGSTDLDAVERSFAHLSIKAKQPKDKDSKTQTPQGLKRTFTNISNHHLVQPSSETSPLLIVQQCLDLLCYLADQNVQIPSLFLTEHDAISATVKRSLSRKGKGKDNKAHKFAINSLLSLLDRDLVMESSTIMDSLSQLLSRVTYPLLALDRKEKEAVEAIEILEAQLKAEKQTEEPNMSHTTAEGDGLASQPETAVSDTTPTQNVTDADMNALESVGGTQNPVDSSVKDSETTELEKALEKKTAGLKKIRQLHPPAVPDSNLTLVIKIFVARECSSKTFKETLSAIKNLSIIQGAMLVFGQELARQAQILSERIVDQLDELLPHIKKAISGTEIQGVALAKFSPGASDQNKLLRVLTALDHLFAHKKTETTQGSSIEETQKQDLLSTLYRNSTFNALWEKLSACLRAIRDREDLLNVATILLPLIEALMVVCKDSTQGEATATKNQAAKDTVLSSPQPEGHMAGLFFTFTEDHRRVLNELVRSNPSLMKGSFSHLVKNPKVLEFDNKKAWFTRSVHNKQQATHRPFPTLQLSVRRDHVFHDSFKSLYFKSGDEMKFGKLNIRFHGEEGVDAGGVTREWFQVLARQMFDANYALFVPVSSDRTTFHPNKLSGINDEHLMFFKFIGRVIGKALYEGRLLECYFSRAVYKRILGKPVSVKDMESFDPEYYKSLSWMLDNDITDIITETFSVEDDEFGVTKIEDLCENGRSIPVTEENKHDYVRLVVEHKLLSSVKEQMEHFLKGFHEIIPADLISIFNEQELELLISGLPDIDIDDWKSNTEYHNYTPSSPQIQWFWRALRSYDKEEVAKLLQFVTGTSKVPLNGFKELEGMNGVNRFNIHRDYGNKDRLPSSHTCFNQLDLPEYESYEALRAQLLKAITTGGDYFGFA
ncbi:hypothetical protein F5Y18DRAFT_104273 [Xylariaceae sp. FL1019]|nr:hypothetical protein F5Y18DRAFT_104273 [Xylariaceae sp. FL1019]